MNLKACCGLLASKDDEDHDYEDVEQEPLPKPQLSGATRYKAGSNVYANAGYSSKASALAASGTSAPASRRNGNSSSNILSANRRSQKAEREAGATSASTSGLASVPPPLSVTAAASSSLSSSSVPPPSSHPDLEENQRQENPRQASSSKTHSREGSGVLSSATTANSSTAREVGRGATVNARGGREGRSSGKEASTRPRPKGAVGVAETPSGGGGEGVSVRGGGFGSGLDKKHVSSGVAPSSTAPVRPPVVAFDLAGFVEKMDAGVLLTKINRQGRAKVRTLFYDEQNGMLWWNETGSSAGRGAHRPLSSSLFLRKEQPLPVASLVQVKMASQMYDPFCFDGDVDKSFQLVFPTRTVDLVAKDAEEAALLARGFQELKASVM